MTFNHLSGSAEGAINLHCEMPGQIRDVLFNGLYIEQTLSACGLQGCYDIRPPCNPQRPTGMGLDNAYNVNPLTGRAHGVEPYPDGLPAFYANGACGLRLSGVHIRCPVPLPRGWHPHLLNVQESEFDVNLAR
ncbi:TPA: hypothetical protein M4K80_003636 [Salmonella enterica]|nr:hypothetical protein [Salmonella enterica]